MFRTRPASSGFTLIELLVVIAIIGILAALVTTASWKVSSSVKRKEAEAWGRRLASAIEIYETDAGCLPAQTSYDAATDPDGAYENFDIVKQLEGRPDRPPLLDAPSSTLNAKGSYKDPWGTPYRVLFTKSSPTAPRPDRFEVWSCGPNCRSEKGGGDDIPAR